MAARILIIEDDTVLLRLYTQVLKIQGYEVESAETNQQARDYLAAASFNLLLCDVQIGHEKSTDLLREMAAVIRESGAVVVLMSADERYRTLGEELGIELFLTKPVAPTELVELVEQFLRIV
jgi:DNA-binding response OmpR family regulator